MEGRAIARPNARVVGLAGGDLGPSMEGRAIARPNCRRSRSRGWSGRSFNGGPGNCPAKPALNNRGGADTIAPSMEGRAIARPNIRSRRSQLTGRILPSMEGRAIARPNRHPQPHQDPRRAPSMEGRAIARPNSSPPASPAAQHCTFNGGPGNCPAKPPRWNASGPPHISFNGGPGNCPAKHPTNTRRAIVEPSRLQWRAGQLPGQTARRSPCRHGVTVPSMEGGAIARPNSPSN